MLNHVINTLKPSQNGCHFINDIFKCIFINENIWISIKITLKFVFKGLINNSPTLIQIIAWCRPGNKPLSEAMIFSLLMHICITQPQYVKEHDYIRSHLLFVINCTWFSIAECVSWEMWCHAFIHHKYTSDSPYQVSNQPWRCLRNSSNYITRGA